VHTIPQRAPEHDDGARSRPVPHGEAAPRSSTPDLTVLVLTLNEEKHIARCLESVRGLARRVVVVDSGSSDQTRGIAQNMGADIYEKVWVNYATQMNWGLCNCGIQTTWVMRLDADEVVTPELNETLRRTLSSVPDSTVGLTINRQIHFMGKWIKHGGIYPIRMLRIWRNGLGRCEDRWMDEHIIVEGAVAHLSADIADINLNNITWWVAKHNQYAVREAIDLLGAGKTPPGGAAEQATMNRQAMVKRWLKSSVYAYVPLGLRCALYFLYRYFLCFGFLDGRQGVAFHFLQGFWYRFLVDVKVYEIRKQMMQRGQTLQELLKAEYGIEI